MSNLTDVYNQLSAADAVYLEKHAAQVKIAEEEDAAGRIMARGFADELTKLAAPAAGGVGVMQNAKMPTGGGDVGARMNAAFPAPAAPKPQVANKNGPASTAPAIRQPQAQKQPAQVASNATPRPR